jgi:hypothetical protein
MTTHSNAIAHEETPHETETIRIRYALEINDPWLTELVSRAEAGENIVDTFESMRTPEPNEVDSTEEKIETLAEIICRAGDESAAALFVLIGTLENSTDPKALANAAKHIAFTRCGELNVFGMVDGQLGIFEYELLAGDTPLS